MEQKILLNIKKDVNNAQIKVCIFNNIVNRNLET